MGWTNKTSKRVITKTQNRILCLELRLQGYSTREIAAKIGISQQAVHKNLQVIVAELAAEEKDLGQEYRERLKSEAEQQLRRLHEERERVAGGLMPSTAILLKIEDQIRKNIETRDGLTREVKAPIIITPNVNVGNPLEGINIHDVLAEAEQWEKQARQPIPITATPTPEPIPPIPVTESVAVEVGG